MRGNGCKAQGCLGDDAERSFGTYEQCEGIEYAVSTQAVDAVAAEAAGEFGEGEVVVLGDGEIEKRTPDRTCGSACSCPALGLVDGDRFGSEGRPIGQTHLQGLNVAMCSAMDE